MIIKFTDGIKIDIDEDKLVEWEQSEDKRYIRVSVKNKDTGYDEYEFDLHDKSVKKLLLQSKSFGYNVRTGVGFPRKSICAHRYQGV